LLVASFKVSPSFFGATFKNGARTPSIPHPTTVVSLFEDCTAAVAENAGGRDPRLLQHDGGHMVLILALDHPRPPTSRPCLPHATMLSTISGRRRIYAPFVSVSHRSQTSHQGAESRKRGTRRWTRMQKRLETIREGYPRQREVSRPPADVLKAALNFCGASHDWMVMTSCASKRIRNLSIWQNR
jgi:hypothetical protein